MATVVWVVGTTRSGTSWVFDLVASHPDVYMGYEAKLPIEGLSIYKRWQDRLTDPLAMAALLEDLRLGIDDPSNAPAFEAGFLQPDIARRLFEAHEAHPGWATICEHFFLALEDTSHWGNKILRIELTPVIEQHWPDSRFLVLTRDPRAVLASQHKKFDHSLDYSAMYWLTHANWVLERAMRDARYRVVDVVDMARDPRPHMEWLLRESRLSLEPLEGILADHPGDPERVESGRRGLDPRRQRRMEEYCFDQMIALGYEPELAKAARPLGAARRVWAQLDTYGRTILSDPGAIGRKQVVGRFVAGLRSRG